MKPVTIQEYVDISLAHRDAGFDENDVLQMSYRIISHLEGIAYEDFVNMKSEQLVHLATKYDGVITLKRYDSLPEEMEINGVKYYPQIDPNEWTAGMYLDLEAILQNRHYIEQIIPCLAFVMAKSKGEKYNADRKDRIAEMGTLPVKEGWGIANFFLRSSADSKDSIRAFTVFLGVTKMESTPLEQAN